MSIINNNGIIYLRDAGGKKVEVFRVVNSEYYNPIGTTPQQIAINIFNPKFNTTDVFYFLKQKAGIQYNSIQTNETAMPLLDLYMSLILNKSTTPQYLISELLKKYFLLEGYSLPRNRIEQVNNDIAGKRVA